MDISIDITSFAIGLFGFFSLLGITVSITFVIIMLKTVLKGDVYNEKD